MYLRNELPEVGDFVIGTVSNISQHQIEMKLDEYKKLTGILYTSEMHRKQIRTLRVLFKKGRKFVCKVLSSDKRGINLSIRTVGAGQERTKHQQFKSEKIADEIIVQLSKQLKKKYNDLFKKIGIPLLKTYNLIYPFFEEVVLDKTILTELKLDKKTKDALEKSIINRIKPKTAILRYTVLVESKASDGLEVIKKLLNDAKKIVKKRDGTLIIKYIGAPNYRFILEHENQKTAKKIMNDLLDTLAKKISKNKGNLKSEELK